MERRINEAPGIDGWKDGGMNGLYEVLEERREGQVMTASRLWF